MSEGDWLRLYPSGVNIQVKVPQSGGDPQWGLRGQAAPVALNLRNSVAQLKNQLSGLLGGMPPARMKLKGAAGVSMKDGMTLAYYNVPDGAQLELTVRDRKK